MIVEWNNVEIFLSIVTIQGGNFQECYYTVYVRVFIGILISHSMMELLS